MLKTRQNFRAPFFALIILLCGAVGLTFEDAVAQDAEMCKLTSVVTMTASDAAETMKLLIANGADVNAKDNNGETPLHEAGE